MYQKLFKRARFLLIFACFLIIPSSASATIKEEKKEMPKFVSGEIIVKFKDKIVLMGKGEFEVASSASTIRSSSILALNQRYGVKKVKRVFKNVPQEESIFILKSGETRILPDLSRTFKFVMPEDVDVMRAIEDFRSDPSVEYVEPNYFRSVAATPNDPRYFEQWGLDKIGLTSLETGTSGWNESTGEASVIIAVIDTGVAWKHEDLESNIWTNSGDTWSNPDNPSSGNSIDDDNNGFVDDYKGWDFVSYTGPEIADDDDPGPRDNNPMDVQGHGTHVSGIASAVTNNAKGIAGVGWHCKIMPLRAGFKTKDEDGVFADDDSAAAIVYAADNGADIINMSWGGLEYSSTIAEAIGYAYGKDVTLIAAAGNSDTNTPFYPAASEKVLAVGATAKNDMRSYWWYYGASNYGDWVDVSAPGGSWIDEGENWILSTLPPTNEYGYNTGTSMAAPHVSGLAGLIKTKFSSWNNDQIMNQIKYTVDYFIYPFFTPEITKRINAYKALKSPRAGIISPSFNAQVLREPLTITGVATDVIGSDFDHYVLEYKPPDGEWTPITSETTSKFEETLGLWNISESEPLGAHELRLRVMDSSGNTSEALSMVTIVLPGGIKLIDSYPAPNPFNPHKERAYITFTLSKPATNVTVFIYDITGKSIYRKKYYYLDSGFTKLPYPGGWDGKTIDGRIVANGVYIYQVVIDGKVATKGKIIVVK